MISLTDANNFSISYAFFISRFLHVKRIIILFILWLPGINALPQLQNLDINPHELIEPSPDVARLGKYGSVPNNSYSGTASISIPLYTINFEEISVPMNLSYSQSGLKPGEEASLVGLGWSVSALTVIFRSIADGDDLRTTYGWIYQPEYIINPQDTTSLPIPDPKIAEIANALHPTTTPDLEPDVFSVNIIGTNLRFLLNKKGIGNEITCTVLNNQTHIVKYFTNTKNFEITNDFGYKFQFNEIELTDQFSSFSLTNVITGWYLTKIISPSGREIIFNYTNSGTTKAIESQFHTVMSVTQRYCDNNNGSGNWPYQTLTFGYGNRNADIRLLSVDNGLEKIIFNYSSRLDLKGINDYTPQKLTSIVVKYNQTAVKTIQFETSYFNDNYINDPNRENYLRLKLDRMQVSDKIHSFEYEQTNNLPEKNSLSIDVWGFYNGKTNNYPFPNYTITKSCINPVLIQFNGGDKDADGNYSIISQLKSITYPTGGYTEFTYEKNAIKMHYDQFFPWERDLNPVLPGPHRNKEVGGLRIATFADYDANDELQNKRTFNYDDALGYSTGLLVSNPEFTRNKHFEEDTYDDFFNGTNYIELSSISLNNLINPQTESHIGYSNVIETFVSSSVPSDNFRMETQFANLPNIERPLILQQKYTSTAQVFISPPQNGGPTTFTYINLLSTQGGSPHTYFEYNGNILRTSYYDNTNQKIWEELNTYQYLSDGKIGATKLIMRSISFLPANSDYLKVDAYQNYFYLIGVFR